MPQMTGEFPRAIPRAVWLTARARNTVHRPVFIGAVGFGTFVATLVALVVAPQQAKRTTVLPSRTVGMRPDTMVFVAALAQAPARQAAVDSSPTSARVNSASPRVATSASLNRR